MSGEPEVAHTPEEETEEEEIKSSYKPPPEKTIEEILAADQEDESLRKYKEALLGQAQTGTVIVGKILFFRFFFITVVARLWSLRCRGRGLANQTR